MKMKTNRGRSEGFVDRSEDVGIVRSGDPSQDRSYFHIIFYVRLPRRPSFVSCDVLGTAWGFCIYFPFLYHSCPMRILLCGRVNGSALLFALLDVPGTDIVSQVVERLIRSQVVSRQHRGGLPEPLRLRGCCVRLSPNSMEKGGEMTEIGRWRSLLRLAAPLPLLWRDRVCLSRMGLSRNLVAPPLAALHVSRAATTRTLRNRMKMALSFVSLFRLVVALR